MPGGRGDILGIAVDLNKENPAAIADAFKQSIDAGYRISNTTAGRLADAFHVCEHTQLLNDVWCYANSKGAVDWAEY